MLQPAQRASHIEYRHDLDGLRGFALIFILIFHANPKIVRGGFIGVDIFFIISGFLITSIVLHNFEKNNFSFIDFYVRRVRRIFPALVVALIGSLIIGWFAFFADEYAQLGKHVAAGAGFIANLMLWSEVGYFDAAAETKPLLHLWSLGIEEQFYILWPFMLWLCWKARIKSIWLTIIVIILSFISCVYALYGMFDTSAAFYAPWNRFWELCCGALVAHITTFNSTGLTKLKLKLGTMFGKDLEEEGKIVRANNIISAAGALVLLFGYVAMRSSRPFPGFWGLVPAIGSMLLIFAGSKGIANRFLSNKVLVWLGLISYPVYLWHWPFMSLINIAELGHPEKWLLFATIPLSLILATLTYYFVENPLRFGGYRITKTLGLLFVTGLLGVIGLLCYKYDGFEFRIKNNPQLAKFANLPKWDDKKYLRGEDCEQLFPKMKSGYCLLTKPQVPDIMIIGDSHSNHTAVGLMLSPLADKYAIAQFGNGATPPFPGVKIYGKDMVSKIDFMEGPIELAEQHPELHTVVLVMGGPLYVNDGKKNALIELNGLIRMELMDKPEIKDQAEIFEIAMRRTLNRLIKVDKNVILLLNVPLLPFDPIACLPPRPFQYTKKYDEKRSKCITERSSFEQENLRYRELVNKILKDYPQVVVFDSAVPFCDDKLCYGKKGEDLMYRDGAHLSLEGTRYLAKYLVPLIEKEIDKNVKNKKVSN